MGGVRAGFTQPRLVLNLLWPWTPDSSAFTSPVLGLQPHAILSSCLYVPPFHILLLHMSDISATHIEVKQHITNADSISLNTSLWIRGASDLGSKVEIHSCHDHWPGTTECGCISHCLGCFRCKIQGPCHWLGHSAHQSLAKTRYEAADTSFCLHTLHCWCDDAGQSTNDT